MEHTRLVHYDADVERLKRVYAEAVQLLSGIGYLATDTEYLILKVSVEDARFELETTLRELEKLERQPL